MKIKCEEVDFSQTDWLVLKQEDLFEQRSNFSVEKVFKIQLNSIKVWKVVYFLYARQNEPASLSFFNVYTVCFWLVSSMHLSQLGAERRNRRPFTILIPKTLDYNFIKTLLFLYPVVSQDKDHEHYYNHSFRFIMKKLISYGLSNYCRCFDYL